MIKRIFSLTFGIGFGLFVGAAVVRRMDQATRAASPQNLAATVGRQVAELQVIARRAADEARRAAAAKEAELRTRFNVPTAQDLLGPR